MVIYELKTCCASKEELIRELRAQANKIERSTAITKLSAPKLNEAWVKLNGGFRQVHVKESPKLVAHMKPTLELYEKECK
jgi:hypothetical protein